MNATITRNNPTCFLFLIDQSHSMAQPFGDRTDGGISKAEGVARALNDLLRNLIITCSKSDGVRNYFEIGVIGYGATVGSAWSGPLAGQFLVPIREVARHYARLNDSPVAPGGYGATAPGLQAPAPAAHAGPEPVWVEPRAAGSTPMCQALTLAYNILFGFIQGNPYCFPPVVVHITDGEATDGDPAIRMDALTALASSNGNVTLFNVHLSSSRAAVPTSFPDTLETLQDPYAKLLFDCASTLTPFMRAVAWNGGMPLAEGSKAFVLNADPSLMVLALEIGTRPGNVY